MSKKYSLTVMFETPFWIGLYERYDDRQYEKCKIMRKVESREQKQAGKERRYALRQEKKRAKHRGR